MGLADLILNLKMSLKYRELQIKIPLLFLHIFLTIHIFIHIFKCLFLIFKYIYQTFFIKTIRPSLSLLVFLSEPATQSLIKTVSELAIRWNKQLLMQWSRVSGAIRYAVIYSLWPVISNESVLSFFLSLSLCIAMDVDLLRDRCLSLYHC